jgi:hypothetical protein
MILPNGPQPDSPEARLEAYLDGSLPPAERDAMLARLEREPALRAEVEAQRRINATLSRRFEAPPMLAEAVLARALDAALSPGGDRISGAEAEEVALARTEADAEREIAPKRNGNGHAAHVPKRAAATTAAPSRYRWLRALAMAAMIIVTACLAAWLVTEVFWPQSPSLPGRGMPRAPMAGTPLEREYRRLVAGGFVPNWVCESEDQFVGTFQSRLGEGLTLAALPQGVQALGLAYPNDNSSPATILLARVGGTPVIVWVDHAAPPAGAMNAGVSPPVSPTVGPGCGLHVYSTQVGNLALHEITPLRQPSVLSLLRAPGTLSPGERAKTWGASAK